MANRIVRAIDEIFNDFWKRHRLNLGLAVAAVLIARKVGVGVVGRYMPVKTMPKHAIKRFDRFLSNRRFDDRKAQEQLLKTVVGDRKRVLIAVDWTKVREWHVLVAGVIQRGRCVPVLWAVMDPQKLYKSQNAFENAFFTWLAQALPDGSRAVVLMDRGFRRVSLVRHLRSIGLSFVIRTSGTTRVTGERFSGKLEDVSFPRSRLLDLPDSRLTTRHPVETRVVCLWERCQIEPWYLMTDLDESARAVAQHYGKRFRIEETFRDEKSHRFGLSLGGLKVTRDERLERILLVTALAHLLAMLAGTYAREKELDRHYRANTPGRAGRRAHSDFTLGLYYVLRIPWRLRAAMALLIEWTEPENWG